jgi:hypothetical protein
LLLFFKQEDVLLFWLPKGKKLFFFEKKNQKTFAPGFRAGAKICCDTGAVMDEGGRSLPLRPPRGSQPSASARRQMNVF